MCESWVVRWGGSIRSGITGLLTLCWMSALVTRWPAGRYLVHFLLLFFFQYTRLGSILHDVAGFTCDGSSAYPSRCNSICRDRKGTFLVDRRCVCGVLRVFGLFICHFVLCSKAPKASMLLRAISVGSRCDAHEYVLLQQAGR